MRTTSLFESMLQGRLRIALAGGDALAALRCAETWRATTIAGPVEANDDPALRPLVAELRMIIGRTDGPMVSPTDHAALVRRQQDLERRIRQVALATAPAAGEPGRRRPRLSMRALRDTLADRALVEWIVSDGHIHAVLVTQTAARLVRVAATEAVADPLRRLRHDLVRTVDRQPDGTTAPARRARVDESRRALSELLLGPLRAGLAGRDVVISPTGALFDVPWAALPDLEGRAIVVAPSARHWLAATQGPRQPRRRLLAVGGPGLGHVRWELDLVSRRYDDARVLADATVETVLEELHGVDVAHFACHGVFRKDNAVYSRLALADGPLLARDLERVRPMPEIVVLSSCDVAMMGTNVADDATGFVAAALSGGARTVIASVLAGP